MWNRATRRGDVSELIRKKALREAILDEAWRIEGVAMGDPPTRHALQPIAKRLRELSGVAPTPEKVFHTGEQVMRHYIPGYKYRCPQCGYVDGGVAPTDTTRFTPEEREALEVAYRFLPSPINIADKNDARAAAQRIAVLRSMLGARETE